MEKARSMLHYQGVSMERWAEAVCTAVYLINRSTNTACSNSTPFQLAYDKKPRLDHLRVFGLQKYAHIEDVKRKKLDSKSFRCMFRGYAENVKGYRLYDLDNLKIKTSRSVNLDEREVAGIYDTRSPQLETIVRVTAEHTDENLSPVEIEQLTDEPMEVDEDPGMDVEMDEVDEMEHEQMVNYPRLRSSGPTSVGHELTECSPPQPVFEEDRLVFHPETTFSRRSRESELLLEDEKFDDEAHQSEWSDGPPSPKRDRIEDEGLLAEEVFTYAANFDGIPDTPNTYAEATASGEADRWSKAIDAELHSHAQNHTWTLIPRKTNIRSIGCRWDFAKKRDESGQVIRYKARLVAQGFNQKFGVDFFETYSPMANMNSIRVVLAVCAAHAYMMEQLDADTAFLNST
uniref:Polyprotein n=1 Tax=Peronospora matthiolae TaxID=2874970 RepID=A0AAV1UZS8_9STRA